MTTATRPPAPYAPPDPRVAPPPPPEAAALDPFALPADTTFRFALLVALVIAASLATFERVAGRVPALRDRYVAEASACIERAAARRDSAVAARARGAGSAATAPFGVPPELFAGGECAALTSRPAVRIAAAGATLVLLAAAALYWAIPAWKLRRDRLEPMTPETGGEIHEALVAASREAGLARPPTFVWNLARQGGTPLAFGRPGRRYVLVPTGLVALYLEDRERFRAVVLHELAHHRNRDVDLTYLAIAVWWAYAVLGLVPFAVSQLSTGLRFDTFPMAWRVAALAALVYLARNAVLRSREVYADARAARWLGSADAVAGALRTIAEPAPGAWARRVPASWRALAATHPTPDARRRLLADPSPLFAPGAWEAVAVGLATAIAMPYLVDFVLRAGLTRGQALGPFLVAGLVCAPLVVGTLGAGAWRRALAARAAPGAPAPRPRLGQAEAYTLGAVVGSVLPVSAWLELRGFEGEPWWLTAGVAFAVWGAVLLATTRGLVAWLAAGARAWLGRDDVFRRPARACAGALAAASLVGVVWLCLLTYAHPVVGGLNSLYRIPALAGPARASVVPVVSLVSATIVLPWMLLVLAVLTLWAYPLGSLVWPGAGPEVAGWRTAVRRAAVGALRAALLWGALFVALRAAVRLSLAGAPTPDGVKVAVHFGGVALGAAIQAALAWRVARRAEWLPATQGLFAASVAAATMVALHHATNLLAFGGSITAEFLGDTVWQYVGGGALAALVAVGLRRRRAGAT